MGEPNGSNVPLSRPEFIGSRSYTCRSDTSQQAEEKKSIRDSHSSGERSGNSLNQEFRIFGVVGLVTWHFKFQLNNLGRLAIQGDSPVSEKIRKPNEYLSMTGHGKSGLNLGGPPSKAKYSSITDSEPVPRGKGEKNPCQGSEIEPETNSLQTVEGLCPLCGNG